VTWQPKDFLRRTEQAEKKRRQEIEFQRGLKDYEARQNKWVVMAVDVHPLGPFL
jgi:hypothetical protein